VVDCPLTDLPLELLARHLPLLRHDSAERHLVCSVASWAQASVAQRPPDLPTSGDVYGHAARGSDGRVWLAYWFFYAANDPRLLGPWLPAGVHEGDWEMIQLRLDGAGRTPDLAVYAQHARAVARRWSELERVEDRPVIYPGRGSHACYFEPGVHWTGVWFERADGRGPAPALTLNVVQDDDPDSAWVHWPGRWGATRPRTGLLRRLGLSAASPHGPGHQRQWRDPTRLLESVVVRGL
jgi:hypothetical protein